MDQDMQADDVQKGRRTEIDLLNGLVVREGEKVGVACRATRC
jgi:2-dehydropantoate 2-reductase